MSLRDLRADVEAEAEAYSEKLYRAKKAYKRDEANRATGYVDALRWVLSRLDSMYEVDEE